MLQYSPFKEKKKRTTFLKYFSELVNFRNKNGRFPEINDNEILYYWTASLRTEKKKGTLRQEFEEKLNAIGFIWDKRNFNWDQNYSMIKSLLGVGEIPTSLTYSKLYGWMKKQFQLLETDELDDTKKKKLKELQRLIEDLKKEFDVESSKLNISAVEIKWNKNFQSLLEYRKLNPSSFPKINSKDVEERKLASWCQTITLYYKTKKLTDSWISKLKEVGFEFDSKVADLKWENKFESLTKFRKENPDSWPQADSEAINERKLGIWCQQTRALYKKGKLTNERIEKLLSISFNLRGHIDSWEEKFQTLKEYVTTNQDLPGTDNKLYDWIWYHKKVFAELSEEKKTLLSSINFLDYFDERGWGTRFEELKVYIAKYGRVPTRRSSPKLYNWLSVQRIKYKQGNLNKSAVKQLTEIGVDLSPGEKKEEIWNNWYEKLKEFRRLNPDRWPRFRSSGDERKLYCWCQCQRQVYAGTAFKRNPLPEEKVQKLNAIGFRWKLEDLHEKWWNTSYELLKTFVEANKTIMLPTKVNGKTNRLYNWLHSQKQAYKQQRLDQGKVEKLKSLGVL